MSIKINRYGHENRRRVSYGLTMTKKLFFVLLFLFNFGMSFLYSENIKYNFDFTNKKHKDYTEIDENTVYGKSSRFGFDLNSDNTKEDYFFSVDLPEGNYAVSLTLGNESKPTCTTVKAESRRLMLNNIRTKKGESMTYTFIVNIRNTKIGKDDSVKIKPKERGALIWDDKLTLEFSGTEHSVQSIKIRESKNLKTIFLAGNSTVVDQSEEPWCGWGQMFPYFLKPEIAVANYAESGLSSGTFIASNRLKKLLTEMKKGDFLFIEFGHNDEKEKGENDGPYKSFTRHLASLIEETRKKGGIPVLITPMHRRFFDKEGKIINTHGEYPNAMRELAKKENVCLIDLNSMSKSLYEAWGPEKSKKAFVYYPAGTFPNQAAALADNTHCNTYGGYEIARCVVKGILDNLPLLKKYVKPEFNHFNPNEPDDIDHFFIPPSPSFSTMKPDGN